jgi:hypothetical protein
VNSKIILAVVILSCFCFGYLVSVFSTKKQEIEFELASNLRSPAAIKKDFDYSGLAGSELDQKFKYRLIAGAQVQSQKDSVGVDLGNFVIAENGEKIFACAKYSTVVFELVGDGQAVSSELPKMEIEGQCEVSADINFISGPKVPVSELMRSPASEGDYTFGKVKLKFFNISGSWPTTWKVVSVRIINQQNSSQVIQIDEKQIAELRGEPLIVKFQ